MTNKTLISQRVADDLIKLYGCIPDHMEIIDPLPVRIEMPIDKSKLRHINNNSKNWQKLRRLQK